MPQITLRLSDELLEEVEEATGPETSRSEWIRNAARMRLAEQGQNDVEDRLNELEQRLQEIEEERSESLLSRWLGL